METASLIEVAPTRTQRAHWPWMVVAIWICASLAGFWYLGRYSSTPGIAAKAPPSWPAGTVIESNPHGATLVMFVHPKCPCTRASVGELEKIVAQTEGRVTPWIVVYKPAQYGANWEQTDLWRTAAAIPGAHVISDLDGAEARRFHAATSGQTLLYDGAGKLLFSGGITESRGHAGDNAGEDAVVDLLTKGSAVCRASPVFGCPILPDLQAH